MKLCLPLLPVAALAALLCAPATGSAQSILLSAGDFVLLGGTAIASDGGSSTSIVTGSNSGNVGLWPAPTSNITGFAPGQVTIVPTGGQTQQAQEDFSKAEVGLAGMPSNENLDNVDLGGLTLAPGVYTFDSSANLTGALVLDANNEANAFWVFQIGTALVTSIGSSVTIINAPAGANNGVFWDAGSGITIGGNSSILGNYLAGTSITFSGNTTGDGRALAQAQITIENNLVNSAGGPDGSDYTGGLTYNDSGAVVPVPVTVPEPAAFLWLAPLGALGFVVWRRSVRVVAHGPTVNLGRKI